MNNGNLLGILLTGGLVVSAVIAVTSILLLDRHFRRRNGLPPLRKGRKKR